MTSSKQIAANIRLQIGSSTLMSIGAKDFMFGEDDGRTYLAFKGSGSLIRRAYIKITYNAGSDDYTVAISKLGRSIYDDPILVQEQSGIYADMLTRMIDRVVG